MSLTDNDNISKPPKFLEKLYPDGYERDVSDLTRPYITLTYAQSIDGCIAGIAGKQILLSGKESMIMTHWYDSDDMEHSLLRCLNVEIV